MNNSIQKALKKIELLEQQDLQKEKMMDELKAALLNLNAEADTMPSTSTEEMMEGEEEPGENLKTEQIAEIKEPVLISVAGMDGRSGTTHHAIEAAGFFCRQKKRTAIMEFNDSGAFTAMAKYWGYEEGENFTSYDISFFPSCTLKLLEQISMSGNYDIVVLDLGVFSEEKTLFSRSDFKLLITGSKPWEIESLLPAFQILKKNILAQSHFLFNFASGAYSIREKIIQGMGDLQNVYFADYIEDPFTRIDESLEKMLGEYIEQPQETSADNKKSVSLFRRNRDEKRKERRTREKFHFVQAVSGAAE